MTWTAGFAWVASLLLAGCGLSGALDAGRARGRVEVLVRPDVASARHQQALVRRWRAADVATWRLRGVLDGAPLPEVLLPAASTGPTTGGWRGLHPGASLAVTVEALASGSPAPVISQAPATATLVLGSGNDLEDRLVLPLAVALADQPFSGTVTFPIVPPAGTSTVSVALLRQPDGLVDWEGELTVVPDLACRLTGLPAGVTWLARVRNRPLSCRKGGCAGPLRQATTDTFGFDAAATLLEDTVVTALGSWN